MKSILKGGILYMPMVAYSEDGTIGDGMIPIDKKHPDYDYWLGMAKNKKHLSENIQKQWKEYLHG